MNRKNFKGRRELRQKQAIERQEQYSQMTTDQKCRSLPKTGAIRQRRILGNTAAALLCFVSSLALAQGGLGGYPTRPLGASVSAVGTGKTVGVTLANPTAAAAGAQQFSPMLEFKGNGWKTNATAASQLVKWGLQLRPVQGAANPTGELVFWSSINAGAYAEQFKVTSGGAVGFFQSGTNYLNITNTSTANIIAPTGVDLLIAARGNQDDIRLSTNNISISPAGNITYQVTSAMLGPSNDLAVTSGGAAKRWTHVYARQHDHVQNDVAFSATPTFDPATGEYLTITMTANITGWTFTAGTAGEVCTIVFIQDGTGSRTLAGTPANVRLAGGALTLTTTINKADAITFRYDATLAKWLEISRSLNL